MWRRTPPHEARRDHCGRCDNCNNRNNCDHCNNRRPATTSSQVAPLLGARGSQRATRATRAILSCSSRGPINCRLCGHSIKSPCGVNIGSGPKLERLWRQAARVAPQVCVLNGLAPAHQRREAIKVGPCAAPATCLLRVGPTVRGRRKLDWTQTSSAESGRRSVAYVLGRVGAAQHISAQAQCQQRSAVRGANGRWQARTRPAASGERPQRSGLLRPSIFVKVCLWAKVIIISEPFRRPARRATA